MKCHRHCIANSHLRSSSCYRYARDLGCSPVVVEKTRSALSGSSSSHNAGVFHPALESFKCPEFSVHRECGFNGIHLHQIFPAPPAPCKRIYTHQDCCSAHKPPERFHSVQAHEDVLPSGRHPLQNSSCDPKCAHVAVIAPMGTSSRQWDLGACMQRERKRQISLIGITTTSKEGDAHCRHCQSRNCGERSS